jgi:hypothetical protein
VIVHRHRRVAAIERERSRGANEEPFRVRALERHYIPGRGWMLAEIRPHLDEDDPRYRPGCNDPLPDDSPLWELDPNQNGDPPLGD